MSDLLLSSPPACEIVHHLEEPSIWPSAGRSVLRLFTPGDVEQYASVDGSRQAQVVARVMGMTQDDLARQLEVMVAPLLARHRNAEHSLLHHFDLLREGGPLARKANRNQRLLIGAYFSEEYSFESTALFNPSIVRHPVQGDPADGTRFVLSLRGVGEGHVSSATFRTGTWATDGAVTLDPPGQYAVGPHVRWEELSNGRGIAHLFFGNARTSSEAVIYPFLPAQGRGLEDLRLTEFDQREGGRRYRGTYTAFDGMEVRQAILQTHDFITFEARGVEGEHYAGKGMALFPRKLGGRYAMLSRQDNRSVFLVYSDDLHRWSGGERIIAPEYPWEWMQIGNCGSPIELDEGFLVLTHGVGAVRTYGIGATLVDKHDPSRIIGRLPEPLVVPTANERAGYVPNIAYTCGALFRDRKLLMPFAIADDHTRFCEISVDRLLQRLERR